MPKILELPPIKLSAQTDFGVHTLLCKKDILLFHWMIRSLFINTNIPFSVTIHEDGSLNEKDIKLLKDSFLNIKIIRRSEADMTMGEMLIDFPSLQEYRKVSFWAIKALDVYALGSSKKMILIDSDILFFKNCDSLFTHSEESFWMKDVCYALGIDSAICEKILEVSQLKNINAGCGIVNRSIYNPKLANIFLEKIQQNPVNDMIFHAIFSSFPRNVLPHFLSANYQLSFTPLSDDIICKHYVNPIRFWFYEEGIPKVASQLKLPLHLWLRERL